MPSDFQSFYQENLARELPKMLPSSILDRYDGLSCFAQSDHGEVYLVRRKSDGMSVILRAAKGEAAEAAASEYEILQSLDHSRIPKALELIKTEAYTYLFREYFPGKTLAQYVRENGIMRKEELINVTLQLCDVLSDLHARKPQVIHRDIKPENIIIDETGQVRLVDFGIARIYREGATSDTVAIGTRPYMAPEQFGGMQTDGRADLFSLGVLMVFMGTGRHDRTNLAFRYPYRDLLSVLNKLTTADPARRYVDADRLARKLRFIRWGGTLRIGRGAAILAAAGALALGIFFVGKELGYISGTTFGEEQALEVLGTAQYDKGFQEGYDQGFAVGYDEGVEHMEYIQKSKMDESYSDYFSAFPVMGNTAFNTRNKGLAVTDEEHIYVCTADGIERMSMDCASREVFLPQSAAYLNLYNEMLYFIHQNRIWCAPLDNSEDARQISDLGADKMMILNEKIYFANTLDKLALYAMALDGTDVRKLNDIQGPYQWNIAGDYMYYMESGTDGHPHRCKLDGSDIQRLDDGPGGVGLVVLGDYLFFMEYDTSSYIRLDLDGSNRTVIAQGILNSVNITPYGIFFSDGRTPGLCRESLGGGVSERLSNQKCAQLNVVGEWIFFSTDHTTSDLYRIRIDGKMLEQVF